MEVAALDESGWAPNRHGVMSELSPFSGAKRKSNFGTVKTVVDPTETLII
jgi:hypothetical protein